MIVRRVSLTDLDVRDDTFYVRYVGGPDGTLHARLSDHAVTGKDVHFSLITPSSLRALLSKNARTIIFGSSEKLYNEQHPDLTCPRYKICG